jgi:hypothetical protein
MWVTAEFREEGAAVESVDGLARAGFGEAAVEVFSMKPVEGLPEPKSRASLIAVAAAVLNGALATAFMYYTQVDYPLVTGGMPLVSPWATGVVTYEMTMAGAMAGVVLAFLWEGRVLRRRRPAAPRLSAASVFVRVRCGEEAAAAVREHMMRSGAAAAVEER